MRWPADLEERFTVAATTGPWAWMVAMPDAEQPGRAYGVISVLLRPLAQ